MTIYIQNDIGFNMSYVLFPRSRVEEVMNFTTILHGGAWEWEGGNIQDIPRFNGASGSMEWWTVDTVTTTTRPYYGVCVKTKVIENYAILKGSVIIDNSSIGSEDFLMQAVKLHGTPEEKKLVKDLIR